MSVEIFAVHGMPEAERGDDIAAQILAALDRDLLDRDVVVVTHKIISKAEGRVVKALTDDDYRAVIEDEAAAIIRRRGALVITQTRHGFVCANAGVDRSNTALGTAVLLPIDPDRSAHGIRVKLERATGTNLAVIVTDTFGRAWRRGLCDVAIGISGMEPILDLRGTTDSQGRVLDVTETAIADEIAAAADLVMGKATGVPVAVVRGVDWPAGSGRARDLVRSAPEDMFR